VLQYLLANGLLRFRIPILFAISGYLFAWRDDGTAPYGARLVRRVRTLAGLSPFQPQANFVSQYTGNQLLLRWLVIPAAFQLWFLRTLIVLTALYPLLRTVSTRWPRVFFTAAVILPLFIIAAAVLIGATLRRGARPVYALLTGGRGL